MSIFSYLYVTSFGDVAIASDGGAIIWLKLGRAAAFPGVVALPGAATVAGSGGIPGGTAAAVSSGSSTDAPSALCDSAARQLEEYFKGERRAFDIPLRPRGTAFQLAVWNALTDIPYGETRSYKQIAQAAGNPNACRAVGMANNKNPIWILIPCHRVIGSDGSLTGYGGGLEMKERLLRLERENCGKPE